jgi:hypothetical protein
MSIPKIAISNEDDSNLRILETRLRSNTNTNASSPYKSIIKTRSSQPQSPASSTTQSYHTCQSNSDSMRKQSSSDQFRMITQDSINKESLPLKRSCTISVIKNKSDENLHQRQCNLRKNNSFTTKNSEQHLLNSVRRVNSYHASPTRRFIIHEDKRKNSNPIPNRRSTLEKFSNSMIQIDTSSVYGTPKHEENKRYSDNYIRLVTDTDINTQTTVNDQSDMQVDVTTNENKQNQPQIEVSLQRYCTGHHSRNSTEDNLTIRGWGLKICGTGIQKTWSRRSLVRTHSSVL